MLWAGALALLLTGTAQATLFDRGGGMIYDSDQDLTWLQDANYAVTSGSELAYMWYDILGNTLFTIPVALAHRQAGESPAPLQMALTS